MASQCFQDLHREEIWRLESDGGEGEVDVMSLEKLIVVNLLRDIPKKGSGLGGKSFQNTDLKQMKAGVAFKVNSPDHLSIKIIRTFTLPPHFALIASYSTRFHTHIYIIYIHTCISYKASRRQHSICSVANHHRVVKDHRLAELLAKAQRRPLLLKSFWQKIWYFCM